MPLIDLGSSSCLLLNELTERRHTGCYLRGSKQAASMMPDAMCRHRSHFTREGSC